jgi:hypothetical protein
MSYRCMNNCVNECTCAKMREVEVVVEVQVAVPIGIDSYRPISHPIRIAMEFYKSYICRYMARKDIYIEPVNGLGNSRRHGRHCDITVGM